MNEKLQRIKTEQAQHRGQPVIKLMFGYDTALQAELRREFPQTRDSTRAIESYTECLRIFFNDHAGKNALEIDNEDVAKTINATSNLKHRKMLSLLYSCGLRHCYATHLMEAGVNLRYLQELLGHRHIKTTEIYLHVSSEAIATIQSPFDTLELCKELPKNSKWYSKQPNYSMLGVINSIVSDSYNRVGSKPDSAVDNKARIRMINQ